MSNIEKIDLSNLLKTNFTTWDLLYEDFKTNTQDGKILHNPFNSLLDPEIETQSISVSAIIEKLGVVNEKFGILYAYTKRGQNFILIGYGSINQYNDANIPIIATINYEVGDQIRFIYAYPEYPYDNTGKEVYNLANAGIKLVHLKTKTETAKILPGTGNVEYLENGEITVPTQNAVLNTPWIPLIFQPQDYPDPSLPQDPSYDVLNNIDDNLDTNLSKLNAILHNMNITKSALLDVNKSNLVNQ